MLKFQRLASSYAQSKVLRKYPVGGIIHGYEIRRILPVPELKLTAVDLVHNQTGSEHLHIDRDDKNNVFSIAFKTNPPDATGVPHILEHTTLCGSEKYPVRDPFFKMLNRSLANFMNAMTAHDYTFYPFATTNKSDYENLRDVYMDATLNPLLKAEDFFQEGWRLEHNDLTDPKSDIGFKGVVYNEMKGQISNANYYFWIKFQESIYPSLNNSGGDPTKITDLKYEDLIDFHAKNYHPSNSRTFTYGNFALEDTLKFLDDSFSGYGKRSKNDNILLPVNIDKTIKIKEKGQIDPLLSGDRQVKSSITWACGSPDNYYETFLLGVLGNLLIEGHSSPFYKSLIESGIGSQYSVNTGMESTTAMNFFTIGVQGLSTVEEFRSVVQNTIKEVLESKFDNKKIEAILQQIELSKKDQKSDFGLQILYSIIPGWSSSRDPFENLLLDETLSRFREDWESQGNKLFVDLINKHILGKPYFEFTIEGSEDFTSMIEKEEASRLESKVAKLNEEDKDVIFKRGQLLQENQNRKEDLTCLPSLNISDIPRVSDVYEIKIKPDTMNRITDTNGITYIRGKRNLDNVIPQELFPYLPLFSDSLTHLGTSREDYSDIENSIKLFTGGISAHVDVTSDPISMKPNLLFLFDGWALNSKTNHITEYWEKLLLNTDFKKHGDKLKVLIRSLVSSNTSSIADSGHSYARGFSGAHISVSKSIDETLSGISQVKFINRLSALLDDENEFQEKVVDKLIEIQKLVINSNDMKYFITTDSSTQILKVEEEIGKFNNKLPKTGDFVGMEASRFPKLESKNGTYSTLIDFPFQVHYTSSCLSGISYTHKDGAPLQVLANMLTFKHLHREIREKGGAYGGGATYSALDGIFGFYSYRDPNPLNSLETFSKSGNYVMNHAQWGQSDINEAKLTIFQQIDAPISRKSEGTTLFHSGVTDEMRQTRREQLLDVTLNDIQMVAEKYIGNKSSVNTVIGSVIKGKTVEPLWEIK